MSILPQSYDDWLTTDPRGVGQPSICPSCDAQLWDDPDFQNCDECGAVVCRECSVRCDGCGRPFCRIHMYTVGKCEFCPSCEEIDRSEREEIERLRGIPRTQMGALVWALQRIFSPCLAIAVWRFPW